MKQIKMKPISFSFKRNKEVKPIITKEVEQPIPKTVVPKENPNPEVQEQKPVGLKTQMEELNKKLDMLNKVSNDKKKQEKAFALPGKVRKQLKKLALKNKLLVLYMSKNKTLMPMVTEIRDGMIMIEGKPHDVPLDSMFLWKGKYPAIVLPEWDLIPFGIENYQEAVREKRLADPAAIVIRTIQASQNPSKIKMSPKAWVFIGLAVIAGIYVLMGGIG